MTTQTERVSDERRIDWQQSPPFITSTAGSGEYHVTVKVHSIKELHAAYDLVLNAFSDAHMSDLASTSEKGRPTDEELNVWSQEYLPDEAHFRVPRLIAEVRRLRASPAPAESGEPEWQPVEERFKAALGRYETPAELAEGLRMSATYWRDKPPSEYAAQPRIMADFHERAAIAIERLLAHPPAESAGSPSTSGVGVTIKPLEWQTDGIEYSCRRWDYRVTTNGTSWGISPIDWPAFDYPYPSAAAAMAEAQASHEARIRSALVYPSDAPRDTQPALLSTDETQEGEAKRFPKTLGRIHEAIDGYVSALVAREHGTRAERQAFDAICEALGRAPLHEMDARRRALLSTDETKEGGNG